LATGKHHGQRLKAKEVLRLYDAGERDFRGAILRGCNFRGADLSGADFSGADIRSAQFAGAILRGTLFCHAKGGLRRRWWVIQLTLISLTAGLTGAIRGFAGATIGAALAEASLQKYSVATAGLIGLIVVGGIALGIAIQGFRLRTIGLIGAIIALSIIGTVVAAILGAFEEVFHFAFAGAVAIGTAAAAGSFAFTGVVVGIVAVTSAIKGFIAAACAFVSSIIFAVIFGFAFYISFASGGQIVSNGERLTKDFFLENASEPAITTAITVSVLVAITSFLLSVYIYKCIRAGEPRFESLSKSGLKFAVIGGTTFSDADLTESSFAYAHLKSTNFTSASRRFSPLTRVRWHNAKKLNRARFESTVLQDYRVRRLLKTLDGNGLNFTDADLRGVNLANVKLRNANLKGASLSGANLNGADFLEANLTNAQCVGTDFTAAHLTGACLEAWNIDDTTVLKDIDCQYVFLKEAPDSRGSRERRPHNPDKDFQPGDFEKFFKEMLDTVQILIRQGIHPQVFKEALGQLMADYDLPADAVRGYERKGEDVLVTVAVPEGTDKGRFEQDFDELQALKLEAAKTQGLLEGERKRADDLKAIMLSLGPAANTVTVTTTAMTNSNNPSISASDGSFVNTGDTMQGNVVNLGELSGQVTNQINQLPDTASGSDQPNLKALLTQLQEAVETDTELSDDEKAEALGEVAKLARAGTNPKESGMQRMAKRATDALKSITAPLTAASKLAEVCKTLLPTILALF